MFVIQQSHQLSQQEDKLQKEPKLTQSAAQHKFPTKTHRNQENTEEKIEAQKPVVRSGLLDSELSKMIKKSRNVNDTGSCGSFFNVDYDDDFIYLQTNGIPNHMWGCVSTFSIM